MRTTLGHVVQFSFLFLFEVICYLTRDFIDMMKQFLVRQIHSNATPTICTSTGNGHDVDESIDVNDMMTMDEPIVDETLTRKGVVHVRTAIMPSEYALKILQDSSILCQYCLLIMFDGLSWAETSTSAKLSHMCQSMIKHLTVLLAGNQAFLRQLYIYVLCALKTHGDNEPMLCTLLTLAVFMYETFHQTATNLFDSVLLEIPDVNNEQVNTYRERMLQQIHGKPLNDKQKRDMLKHLVQPLIGSNVAQMFRREPVVLNDLPPLIRFSKRSTHPVLLHKQSANDHADDDHGLANLFQPTDD
jgi:hypothetical protein